MHFFFSYIPIFFFFLPDFWNSIHLKNWELKVNYASTRKGCKLEKSASKKLRDLTVRADNKLEGIMVQVTFMRPIIF